MQRGNSHPTSWATLPYLKSPKGASAAINPLDLCSRNCTGLCPEASKASMFQHLLICHPKFCAGRLLASFLPQNVAVVQLWFNSWNRRERWGRRGQGAFPQGPVSSTAHPPSTRSTRDCQVVPSSSQATALQHLATTA